MASQADKHLKGCLCDKCVGTEFLREIEDVNMSAEEELRRLEAEEEGLQTSEMSPAEKREDLIMQVQRHDPQLSREQAEKIVDGMIKS